MLQVLVCKSANVEYKDTVVIKNMPFTKEIGKSPVYHSRFTMRRVPIKKCNDVIRDFKQDKITHQRDTRKVGCVLMYEDIYDAHVETLCGAKKNIFDQIRGRHLKTTVRWN